MHRLWHGQTLYQILAKSNNRQLCYSDINVKNFGARPDHGFQSSWISLAIQIHLVDFTHAAMFRNQSALNWIVFENQGCQILFQVSGMLLLPYGTTTFQTVNLGHILHFLTHRRRSDWNSVGTHGERRRREVSKGMLVSDFSYSLIDIMYTPGACRRCHLYHLAQLRWAYYKSPAVEAKNTFSYIVMQVIWCLKFCNMTKPGGGTICISIPPLQILGDLSSPRSPHDLRPCVS